jgi:hypothetical protein
MNGPAARQVDCAELDKLAAWTHRAHQPEAGALTLTVTARSKARPLPPPAAINTTRVRVASQTYRLFEQAMRLSKQILCMYDGYPRELCPIILGHSQGQEKALTYQFSGQSKSGLPSGGEWRCLWLSKISNVQLRDGPLLVGSRHTRPQGCVQDVDLDANPASPYHPKRLLRTAKGPPARPRSIRRRR